MLRPTPAWARVKTGSHAYRLDLFFQFFIIGTATGSLIALIALGYTLVYGIIELINFAHGEVFMMGAFFAATIAAVSGVTSQSSYPQSCSSLSASSDQSSSVGS